MTRFSSLSRGLNITVRYILCAVRNGIREMCADQNFQLRLASIRKLIDMVKSDPARYGETGGLGDYLSQRFPGKMRT